LAEKYIAMVNVEISKELAILDTHIATKNFKGASVVLHAIKRQCDYLAFSNCKRLNDFRIEKEFL